MVQFRDAQPDESFAALSDATRRGILERLAQGDASMTELAEAFRMTLTGMKKHVSVLDPQEGRWSYSREGPSDT